MSTIELTPQEEAEIKIAADAMIRTAAHKANMNLHEVPEQARQDAYSNARKAYEEQKAKESNPMWAELKAEREAHAQTQRTLAATQQVRPQPVSSGKSNLPAPEIVRARMGERDWRALTNDGRLIACGLDPAGITAADVEESKMVFARGANTAHAIDLSKRDWSRYKRLKNLAIVGGWQGQ